MASGSAAHSLVDPTTSEKRKVTVPLGTLEGSPGTDTSYLSRFRTEEILNRGRLILLITISGSLECLRMAGPVGVNSEPLR